MSLTLIQRMAVAASTICISAEVATAEEDLKEKLGYCAFEAVSAIGIPGAELEILQEYSEENNMPFVKGGRLNLETPEGDIYVEAEAVNDERIQIKTQHPNLEIGIDHKVTLKIDFSGGEVRERESVPYRNFFNREMDNIAKLWAIHASEAMEVVAMECMNVYSAHPERSIHAAFSVGPPPYIEYLADAPILTE